MKNMGQSAKQTNKKAQTLSCSSKSFDFTCNLLAHAKQVQSVGMTEAAIHRWNKAFKNRPSKICGSQCSISIPPEKVRKPKVFCYRQGI